MAGSRLRRLIALAAPPGGAPGGAAYAPRHGQAFHGVSDTGNNRRLPTLRKQVGAHPAVLQDFFHWDMPLTTGALHAGARPNPRRAQPLHRYRRGEEMITPRQIAKGEDDHYMTRDGGQRSPRPARPSTSV